MGIILNEGKNLQHKKGTMISKTMQGTTKKQKLPQ
jgi:hypothetical protein